MAEDWCRNCDEYVNPHQEALEKLVEDMLHTFDVIEQYTFRDEYTKRYQALVRGEDPT